MYVHVHVYVNTYIYIHTYVDLYMSICVLVNTCLYVPNMSKYNAYASYAGIVSSSMNILFDVLEGSNPQNLLLLPRMVKHPSLTPMKVSQTTANTI